MSKISLKATARVKLIKKDENGDIIEVVEKTVELTEEEAKELWLSQMPACST